jgi:large subunit ribosomal protein L7/L12
MSTRRWSAEIQALGDRIAGLTTAGAAELHKHLEVVYGIKSVTTPVARRDPVVEPTPPPPPTEFRVVLEGFDPARKVHAIKAVRELLTLGLKEARDLVESSGRVLKEGLGREEADKLKAQLEAVGLVVSVTGVVAERV